jgi:RND family efflux transporter MFP subunit
MTVAQSGMADGLAYAGEVRARTESRLGFRVGGKLIKRMVDVGDRVRAGQVLAQLDVQDYQLAQDGARAQAVAAGTQRDLAAADLKRFKELREQGFISGAELERREATLKAAQAQFDQAQAQLGSQSNLAAYTQLRADVSGVVTGVEAEPGQVLAGGSPVVRLAQDGARDVVFAVPEDKLAAVKVGMTVNLKQWGRDSALKGIIRELATSADPVTRTFQVKAALDQGVSWPLGTTAYVQLQTPERAGLQAIKLPTSALWLDGKQSAVWVLDTASMSVRAQHVEVNTADGSDAVVADGLQPGMQVVTAGVHVLSPGQKVTIYKEPVSASRPDVAATHRAPAGK